MRPMQFQQDISSLETSKVRSQVESKFLKPILINDCLDLLYSNLIVYPVKILENILQNIYLYIRKAKNV
jgi:hypothetical protein